MTKDLDIASLYEAACAFADEQSRVNHTSLIGVTDGKAVGTHVEHLFDKFIKDLYPDIQIGNSAKGIDLPDIRLNCDIKVTSIRQPQSSCPYKDSRQKIFGLGYNLLLFVYEKTDTEDSCMLDFKHIALIDKNRTADYTLTRLIRQMLECDANNEDLIALFTDKALPGDEITLSRLAEEVLETTPAQGYLTISNALQWRLQYKRVISLANSVEGIENYDR